MHRFLRNDKQDVEKIVSIRDVMLRFSKHLNTNFHRSFVTKLTLLLHIIQSILIKI
jgi:hypothetical protein